MSGKQHHLIFAETASHQFHHFVQVAHELGNGHGLGWNGRAERAARPCAVPNTPPGNGAPVRNYNNERAPIRLCRGRREAESEPGWIGIGLETTGFGELRQ